VLTFGAAQARAFSNRLSTCPDRMQSRRPAGWWRYGNRESLAWAQHIMRAREAEFFSEGGGPGGSNT
jgi:hypothetical protein